LIKKDTAVKGQTTEKRDRYPKRRQKKVMYSRKKLTKLDNHFSEIGGNVISIKFSLVPDTGQKF
jgi:hypothetical protein